MPGYSKVNLEKTVIVDNLAENFQLQRENGFWIKSWFNDNPSDKELLKLANILKLLQELPDVRMGLRQVTGPLTQVKI